MTARDSSGNTTSRYLKKHLLVTNQLQGDEERELLKEENVVNATLTEYLEEAKLVRRSVIKVGKNQKGRMQTAKWMKVADRVHTF